MSENPFSPPERDRTARRDRVAGALVTVLFHALLGLLVYYGRFTVRILPIGNEEVRTIVIVPPLEVSLPRIVGGRGLADLPSPPSAPRRPGAAADRPEEPETGEEAVAAPSASAEAAEGPAGGWLAPPPGSASAIPSLSAKFQRSITTHGKSDLNLPLAPPGTPPGPPGIGGGAPLPDFSKYGRGAYGGSVGGYGTGTGRAGTGGSGRQRVGMSIPLKDYDLLPWATSVIDRLQVNWTLPAVQGAPDGAKIGMIVVIKKTGDLDSIEILEGTSFEILDRAALEALRLTLPFPPLPPDFPGDLLEITFEFIYND